LTLVGAVHPDYPGGPWNVVVGSREALRCADTLVFEASERDTLGGLNLGSIREVNGRRVVAGAFTYGVTALGGSYAFGEHELVRELTGGASDRTSFGLVLLAPGADLEATRAALARRVPEARVLTRAELDAVVTRTLLTKSPVGIVFGASTAFGLVIGFVIVALSMISAVVDNLRDFGVLKALGCTDGDVTMLLLAQAGVTGALGATVGLALVSVIVRAISSAKLTFITPPWLTAGTFVAMIGMCAAASALAAHRVRDVEPATVFR
jgi:putative ABC transport system permease protein